MKLTVKLYFNIAVIFLFPLVVISLKEGTPTMIMYCAVIPVGNLLFYSLKSAIYWFIYIVILIFVAYIISDYAIYDSVLESKYIKVSNFVNILIFLFLLLFFYLTFFRFLLKRDDLIPQDGNQDTAEKQVNENNTLPLPAPEEDKEKLKPLYDEIVAYFEKQKPYASSDFRISQMADALKSNTSYVSGAISKYSGLNFNSFVNKYRIEYAKQMIREGYLDKYSMAHIYSKAGFKYQSTFNEIFKKLEGVTPREYEKNL